MPDGTGALTQVAFIALTEGGRGRGPEAYDLCITSLAQRMVLVKQLQSFQALPGSAHIFIHVVAGCNPGNNSFFITIECDTRLQGFRFSLKCHACSRICSLLVCRHTAYGIMRSEGGENQSPETIYRSSAVL